MDFLVIDAQYYLRRNYSVICNNEDFTKRQLLDSFTWTVLKIHKLYPARKIILLWDKRPYIKAKTIELYKGDRYDAYAERDNVTEVISDLEKQVNLADEDKQKLTELKAQLTQINKDISLFEVFSAAKFELMTEYSKFGFCSIQVRGFEADDLARLLAILSDEKDYDTLLVSGDSDWICMPTRNAKVLHWKSNTEDLYTVNTSPIPEEFKGLVSPFEYYQLNDIYSGGHNNVVLEFNRDKYNISDIVNFSKNKDNIPTELTDFYKYYEALNIDKYYKYISNFLNDCLLLGATVDWSYFYNYYDSNKITVYKNYMISRIRELDSSLYQGKWTNSPFKYCECGIPIFNDSNKCQFCESMETSNENTSKNSETIS